jgi:hypothetical protein
VRGIALGRNSWLFCGSDRGGERAAVMYSLIVTAKMNDVDPQANCCHGIGALPFGTLIKPPEPKMTRARSSPAFNYPHLELRICIC